MSPDLDRQLCEKYPLIFSGRQGNPRDTLMCFGFEVGNGWHGIIDSACWLIQHHIDESARYRARTIEHNRKVNGDPTYRDPAGRPFSERSVPVVVQQVEALQVKEKFGTLRFYCSGGDDYTRGVLDMAEAMSGRTCERCGSPGKLRYDGWARTLCDQHLMAEALGAGDDFLP